MSQFEERGQHLTVMGKSRLAGLALVIAGLAASFPPWLGMFSAKSNHGELPIHKWQVAAFAFGVWLFGWGVALLLSGRWHRWGIIYMLAITPLAALIGLGLAWQLPT